MAAIEPSSVVRRRDGLLANELSDEESVMLDVDRGMYFGVREVGKAIWDRIEEPTSVGDLCTQLTELYDVDRATCEAEVIAFLVDLESQGLIETDER